MDLDSIKDLVFQCAIINTSDIVFTNKVREACEKNYCGKYNACWSCPPAVGDVDTLKAKCLKYNKVLVFTTVGKLEDSFDFEGMMQARKDHDKVQQQVYDKLNLKDCLLLGAGGCTICKKCNYPNPCRFPDKVVHSIESYGIYVVDMAKTANINYINGENTVTYFSVIFFN